MKTRQNIRQEKDNLCCNTQKPPGCHNIPSQHKITGFYSSDVWELICRKENNGLWVVEAQRKNSYIISYLTGRDYGSGLIPCNLF